MIDIHCHILFDFDDGSECFEESVKMAEMAYQDGITAIVATPHCAVPSENRIILPKPSAIKRAVSDFQSELKSFGFDIAVTYGAEVFGVSEISHFIERGEILTINNSRYILIEFFFDDSPLRVEKVLDSISALGLVPIIAHPERYFFVIDDIKTAYSWANSGYILQQNTASALGGFGEKVKKTADKMLDLGIVGVISTDAHGIKKRKPLMSESFLYVSENYSQSYAKALFSANPTKIVLNNAL